MTYRVVGVGLGVGPDFSFLEALLLPAPTASPPERFILRLCYARIAGYVGGVEN